MPTLDRWRQEHRLLEGMLNALEALASPSAVQPLALTPLREAASILRRLALPHILDENRRGWERLTELGQLEGEWSPEAAYLAAAQGRRLINAFATELSAAAPDRARLAEQARNLATLLRKRIAHEEKKFFPFLRRLALESDRDGSFSEPRDRSSLTTLDAAQRAEAFCLRHGVPLPESDFDEYRLDSL